MFNQTGWLGQIFRLHQPKYSNAQQGGDMLQDVFSFLKKNSYFVLKGH
jgi:hypothetical protein